MTRSDDVVSEEYPLEVMARLKGVTKTYGSVVALDAVSLVLHRCVTAVLGPNGAGKSTLVEIMAGLRRPGAGLVEVLGGDPTGTRIKARIGITVQTTALPWRLTVAETLDLLAAHYPRPLARGSLVDSLDLGAFQHKRNGALSGGQRRRVALAAALIGDPELLFLDEPTVGLDADSRDRMWAAISASAARGTAAVLTTHDMTEAEHLADQVVVVSAGRLARTGRVDEVCAEVGLQVVDFELSGPLCASVPAARVEVRGNRTRVYTADPDAVIRALVHTGVPFRGIRVARASLEEAIRAITGPPPSPSGIESRVAERVA